MTRAILIILTALISLSLHARIEGCVRDNIGEPVEGAVVSLIQKSDSTITDAQTTDINGAFIFNDTNTDDAYRLSVYCPGYKEYVSDANDGDFKEIILENKAAHTLAELRVTASKPTVRHELGKFIIQPNSYSFLANNSYELLGLMPMISRNDKGYSIIGGGTATIWLNGRKPIMSQEQVMRFLQSVPPQNIKEIELVQNSGASQRGSIINVWLDRPDEGFLGNADLNGSYHNGFQFDGAAMVYYSIDRVAMSAQIHGGMGSETNKSQKHTVFKESGLTEDTYYRNRINPDAVNTDLQMQYRLSYKSYIGVFARIRNNFTTSSKNAECIYSEHNATMPGYNSESKTYDSKHTVPTTVVATYHLDIDKLGSYVEAVADMDFNSRHNQTDWQGSDINSYSQYYRYLTNAYSVKADLVKNFKNSKLDAGYSFLNSYVHNEQLNDSHSHVDDYYYREFFHQAYANFMHKPADWIQYSLGLRLEGIRQHIDQRIGNEKIKNGHFDLMPDIALTFFLPRAAQQIQLTYKNELSRPSYREMNPLETWTSESNCSRGNPWLKPSRFHIASIFYMWNYQFYGQVLYNYNKNQSAPVLMQLRPGVSVNTYENLGKYTVTRILAGWQKMLFRRWQFSLTNSAIYKYSDSGEFASGIKNKGWYWNFDFSNYIVLSQRQRLNASVNFSITSPYSCILYSRQWTNDISVSINKQFGDDLEISVSAANFIPRSRMTVMESDMLYYESRDMGRQEMFRIGLSYTFGKNTIRRPKTNSRSTVSSRK